MSVQAMAWALEQRLVTEATARHVLLCLANYADKTGAAAFPSAGTLASDTGLSERSVRSKLDMLEAMGAIRRGNQAVAAAHIARGDRRPVVYDIVMERGAGDAPRSEVVNEVQDVHPVEPTGCSSRTNGVQLTSERGAPAAPDPSINHQGTISIAHRSALRFSEWWEVYPKKVGRKPCLEKWKAKHLDAKADELIADVQKRITGDGRWLDGFIPDPKTYLAQERWADELQPRRAPPQPNHPSPGPVSPSPVKPPESKLANAISYARQQRGLGVIDDAELGRMIAAARQRYPAEAHA